MVEVARVVLAIEEHDVAEEVMHFLDRNGRIQIVGMCGDGVQLVEAVRQLEPDAVVAQPSLAGAGLSGGAALLAVETRESVAALRSAIRAGARGFYVWPADRQELLGAAEASAAPAATTGRRATVVAVYGPRGGVGATFVATHLSAAFARRSAETVLIDMDPIFGDVAGAIGAPTEGIRTVSDVLPLIDELSPAHLDEILWPHPDGFRALLAPEAEEALAVGANVLRTAVEAAASSADVVILHLPRALDEFARCGFAIADRVLVVLSLDVLAFRDAKRAMAAIESAGALDKVGFVVNRAHRAEVTPADVGRVFGNAPIAVIPVDAGVAAAQDHGRLLPRRGRTGRAFEKLAAKLATAEEEDREAG